MINNLEIIKAALAKGAKVYSNISGGKDGQAMSKVLGSMVHALVHADLGKAEWPESLPHCKLQAKELNVPLFVVYRSDGKGLIERMKDRMATLKAKGEGKPFWPSSESRYCTSDLKRDPIDTFYRNLEHDFIISAEGIRAQESKKRSQKNPLAIRTRITSTYYKGMTVDEAIAAYTPGKRLALTWYPIFNATVDDVWATYGMTEYDLMMCRRHYKSFGEVRKWWPFHPAYAYGNDRVSCVFCILGSPNDLAVGAREHPELLEEYIVMEYDGEATFKKDFSLKNIRS